MHYLLLHICNKWNWIFFANFDLAGTNIYTDANCHFCNRWCKLFLHGIVQLLVQSNAIIDPTGGHGTDDIAELGGHFVMLQSKLEPSDSDVVQVNDFRRVGIVKNPKDSATNNVATLSTARTTNAILMLAGGNGTYQD